MPGTPNSSVCCNFYPRSPCGERPEAALAPAQAELISIHALLAESDPVRLPRQRPGFYFYPRSPCGERRARIFKAKISIIFLSTLSLRRATEYSKAAALLVLISIHALLAESDPWILFTLSQFTLFLSTLSLRRATALPGAVGSTKNYFYPRSPCGERPTTV